MKLTSIFLILIVQAHSFSFFGDFQNVMTSLKNDFKKLITDVVTDVKDTIDCTVLAVESALSLDVIANNPQNPKCNEANENRNKNDRSKGDSTIDEFSPGFLNEMSFVETNEDDNLHRKFSKRIEVSVATINETISDIVRKKDERIPTLENAKNTENDYDHFNNVNVSLKKGIENISSSIKDELNSIHTDQNLPLDSIIKYINVLHDVEHNSEINSEVNEVCTIVDDASKKLCVKVKSEGSDDENLSNKLTNLEPNSNRLNNVQSNLTKLENNNNLSDSDNSPNSFPRTFKDIFAKKLDTTPVTINENNESQYISRKSNENEISRSSTVNDSDQNISNYIESMESNFDSTTDNGDESHKEALEQAKKLIEESQRTDSILGNIFAKVDQSGTNIFDNP